MPTEQLRVAYLVSQYPALSHTFIESEINGLRELGVEVHTFSVRPAPQAELITPALRAEAARTEVILGRPKAAILRAQARLARRSPQVYATLLARAARTGLPTPKGRLWQLFYFAEGVILWQLLQERGLRHVHVHMANVAADVARTAVAIGTALDGPDAGWRWSLTVHGPGEFEVVQQWDVPDKIRSARAIAPISDFCRSQLMRLVEPEQWAKMRVVRMTVDTSRFAPPISGRADHGGPLRVLSVGRLVPQKGGPVLIDALNLLAKRGIAVVARIAGGGPLDADLRAAVRRLGLADRVEFLGPVAQEDIVAQYHWADVFVLPSFQEGLPVVLMEAMATGLPVVTTQIAAVPELVADGDMGRVVPAGRADLIADALAAEAALGVAGRHEQGRRGRAAVEREFTSATAAPAMAEFLRAAGEPQPLG
ncbi:MAG: glycosyltransferase family 4 protein [Austwickia sp.]|nr:glycosyltransferase family 4 protein [Austwickia sp.]